MPKVNYCWLTCRCPILALAQIEISHIIYGGGPFLVPAQPLYIPRCLVTRGVTNGANKIYIAFLANERAVR
jgi:hypothetical protein